MKICYWLIEENDDENYWNRLSKLDTETNYILFEPKERPKNLELIKNNILKVKNNVNFILLATINEKIVSYISLNRDMLNKIKHIGYIVIGVLKDYRGLGIGSNLFNELELWARNNKITKLELTVICENTIAKNLYDSKGFIVEGVKKNSVFMNNKYYDEYYMGKVLK
ncbi:GNAT family N-acetyltransferase [Miniphocaeibacter massiliensis]|uniref:GNAT family N-acetyltransferase n=1 Tax=Miniphocaeibacter massiliensis TaxID=2041841 RepID=UPI000C1BC408|nr:GNAT family N-acetyltransferase [Miniphocaeibacter massiliensis]